MNAHRDVLELLEVALRQPEYVGKRLGEPAAALPTGCRS
jgi:hypothetical protein